MSCKKPFSFDLKNERPIVGSFAFSKATIFIEALDRLFYNKLKINNEYYLDMAIFPFIRQFLNVDLKWFEEASYINLKKWVERISISDLFTQIMKKPTI